MLGLEHARVDLTGVAIDGEDVFATVGLAIHFDLAFGGVNLNVTRTGHTALAPSPGHHCGVGSHPAGGSQNAVGHVHAVDILGAGFFANQDDFLALLRPFHGFVGGEGQSANRGTW